jgi:hypothetical protein
MQRNNRVGGMALVTSGILLALGMLLHPDILNPQAAIQPLWNPAHLLLIIGLFLALCGLPMLYVRQIQQTGGLGLAGFSLMQIGAVLLGIGLAWMGLVLIQQRSEIVSVEAAIAAN